MNKIYVYEEFSSAQPKLMGTLYAEYQKGKEHNSFEFDTDWLKNNQSKFSVDPDLQSFRGRQFPLGKNTFGLFADASPDRWGRTLMDRRERFLADAEGRKPRRLNESDYLIGVYDELRMGALRFKETPDGEFLSNDKDMAAPPWVTLRSLEEASRNFENEETTMQIKWLNQLIKPGSSLGGARPKATVQAPNGELWIAKFPSRKDDYDVGAWEKTAYDLARLCGLNVPECTRESFSKYGSTFLVKRFDRNGMQRVHFASAMTMLGKTDGASAADGSSYLELVSFLKSNGATPKKDLVELWKRVVFNMAISNTDDHLRNHGFLLTRSGWQLAPLYDINPVPYGDTLSLLVDDNSNEIDIDLAIETAPYYGISKKEASIIATDICKTVDSEWERIAVGNGLSRAAINNRRPAFSAGSWLNK